MPSRSASTSSSRPARPVSTSALLGQVMFLVAAAIAFCTAGTFIGKDLTQTSSWVCYGAALVMLLAPIMFNGLSRGPLGIGWLMAIGLLIGLSLGPALNLIAEVQPGLITEAAALTALITLVMGSIGLAVAKDLSSWVRILSFIVFAAVIVSLGSLLFGGLGSLSPVVSGIILIASSLAILVDFNYIRHKADSDDVVWIATSMFVSIVNIFISLLGLLRND